MKRDLELVRKILLKVEQIPTYDQPVELNIENYKTEEINYHVGIMWQAGLLNIFDKPIKTLNSPTRYLLTGLTWQGHEFLDASRSENAWKKAMKTIKDKGGGLTFEIVKALLIQYTKQELNISSN
jgi:hypothetical protein